MTTPETTPLDIERLNAAVTEAEAKLAQAETDMNALADAKKRDMPAMLKQLEVIKGAEKDVSRSKAAVERFAIESRKEERMAAAVDIKTQVEALLAGLPPAYFGELGLRGITVGYVKEDGTFTVSIGEPKAAAPKGAGGSGKGGGQRQLWQYDGKEYTSRDLLLAFDGERGAEVVDKTDNWQARGLSSRPGIDAPTKALARRMGWNGGDDRILTHAPEVE